VLIPVARRGRDARKAARPMIEDMVSVIEYIKMLRRARRSGDVRCGGALCLRWFDVSTNESQGNARDLAGYAG